MAHGRKKDAGSDPGARKGTSRRPAIAQHDHGAAKTGRRGQIQKGEVRNPWGPRGNPNKREAELNVGFEELLAREMRRRVTITEDGKEKTLSMHGLLAKKIVRDLIEGPPKLRLDLFLNRRSTLRDMMERLAREEDEAVLWTDELEKEFRVIESRYGLDQANDARALSEWERDFYSWCGEERARLGDTNFDCLSHDERVRAFRDARDDGAQERTRDDERDNTNE